MWKKTDEEPPRPLTGATATTPNAYAGAAAPRPEPRRSGSQAVIGSSIRIEGDIRGDEDLLIEGEVQGNVNLEKNSVTIGPSGRIKADVHGRNISVEGKVQGNLFADEQVVVRESGEVRGNITAPRVSLEDGAKFKGAIDMEPKAAKERAGGERGERAGERASGGGRNGEPAGAATASTPATPAAGEKATAASA